MYSLVPEISRTSIFGSKLSDGERWLTLLANPPARSLKLPCGRKKEDGRFCNTEKTLCGVLHCYNIHVTPSMKFSKQDSKQVVILLLIIKSKTVFIVSCRNMLLATVSGCMFTNQLFSQVLQ